MGLGKKKKKGTEMPPPPGMPLPPMPPPPGMPLPVNPPASAQPTQPAPLPIPAPTPAPADANTMAKQPPVAPGMPLPTTPAQETPASAPSDEDTGYSGLYAKKSGKPLKQVYGHIDRISHGEIGSLLDRYSDRFGHELDRDIIVMRKEEREEKAAEIRDSPTVQLLNEEEEEEPLHDGDTLVELHSQLGIIETELRRLKPEYQTAKSEGDREVLRELKPMLQELMSERKLLKGIISGEIDISELNSDDSNDEDESEDEYEDTHEDEVDSDDIFLTFVEIVDNLLGSNLPEDAINEFTESDGFEIYKEVGSSPESADEELRSEFFRVVDSLLGGMPEEAVEEFVQSPDFDIYRTIGGMYN